MSHGPIPMFFSSSLSFLILSLYAVHNTCSSLAQLKLAQPQFTSTVSDPFTLPAPMGKKGLTSIFSRLVVGADDDDSHGGAAASPSWPWPSCGNNPQTVSFHRDDDNDQPCSTATAACGDGGTVIAAAKRRKAGEMYKTVNSVYFDYSAADAYSCFDDDEEEDDGRGVLDDDDDGSFSTTTASEEWSEAVIRSLGRTSTDRFFFDPGPPTNSILTATAASEVKAMAPSSAAPPLLSSSSTSHDDVDQKEKLPEPPASLVEESVAVAVESEDPYRDFRSSMEEMVAAHGLRGWDALEELLVWYLRVNGKHNHALIVGAFVDLLIGLAATTSAAATTTPTTTTSSGRSTASTSTACDVTTTSATTTMEPCPCGGGGSSAASSDDLEEEEDASDDLTRSSIAPSTLAVS
ncbi:hypothetical protein E2562_034718 [Oryza meyeriana var. granulata]|uniref:Transcription repressor n=1 Tax=Oryza meyeriana var. granulata TaxID=110450 RepID=A0A6G1CAL1_9ORYZ|nr:hypothetical protein E2562_034718 [Oryza meyeriana var. granulata]